MLINVIDAETKACPISQAAAGNGQGTCRGEQCMGWRFADLRRVVGYCGFAGTPIALGNQP